MERYIALNEAELVAALRELRRREASFLELVAIEPGVWSSWRVDGEAERGGGLDAFTLNAEGGVVGS